MAAEWLEAFQRDFLGKGSEGPSARHSRTVKRRVPFYLYQSMVSVIREMDRRELIVCPTAPTVRQLLLYRK